LTDRELVLSASCPVTQLRHQTDMLGRPLYPIELPCSNEVTGNYTYLTYALGILQFSTVSPSCRVHTMSTYKN